MSKSKVGEIPDEEPLGRFCSAFSHHRDICKYKCSDAQAHIQTDGSPGEKEIEAGDSRRDQKGEGRKSGKLREEVIDGL